MKRFKHIVFILTIAFTLLGGAGLRAQGITVFAEQPFTFTVDVQTAQEDNITWEIYDNFIGINMAVVPGNCPIPASAEFVAGDNTGSSVDIVWHVPGTYIVKVRAVNDCPTDNMKFYLVTVLEAMPVATIQEPAVICEGDDGTLVIDLDGDAPFSIVLHDETADTYTTYNNITTTPFVITVNPTVTTIYTITQVTDIDGTVNTTPSNSVTLIVNPRPVNGNIYQYTP
ncbi:MAG TPA: hypothetical protein VK172_08440 [Lentimicrobium sp.]|nr:hypothetical protein [Lentimicrobium sp.]